MRIRITVESPARAVVTDLFIEAEPDEKVADVVERIADDLELTGQATVDGLPVAIDETLGQSRLRPGSILRFGPAPQRSLTEPDLMLHVDSGPDAGKRLALNGHSTVEIGRRDEADMALTDGMVSATHALLKLVGDHFELADAGGANGTFVDGIRLTSPMAVGVGTAIQVGRSRLSITRPAAHEAITTSDGQGGERVTRTFRHRPGWKPLTIEAPAPPEPDDEGRSPVLLILMAGAPLLLALGYAFYSGQWRYVLFGLLGPVGAAGTWWVDRSRRTRRRERKQKEFELESQRARYALQTSADEEDAFLRREWPDPRVVLGAISPPSTMLWCRRPSDDDWLRVRFGTADRPAQAQVNRTSRSAALPAQVIRQAPVGLSLNDHRVVGIAGDPAATADTMAWVGLQLAAWHGPDELDIVVIGQQPREYGWLRWIPHAKPAWTTGSIAERVKQLNELLSGRLEHSSRMRSERFGVDTVAILVGMSGLEQRESLERLLAQGPEAGLAFICVERDGRDLSRACSAVLEVSGRAARLRGGGHETMLACEGVPQHEAERAARALAPLLPAGAGGASGLPDSVHYFDLVGEPTPESIRAAWRMPSQPTSVPIGRDGDAQFEVDIALDGPHGVIAGTTGSGKSVVLQTVLAGLALKNPPDRMNFMFVDYKGGASFLQMAELPHVVGFVSNLDETLARRAFAAIDAEMTRRQEVLAAAGAADFLTYQRLRRDNPALAPLSRLVVVVDEFAELKEAIPDVAKDFESVARIGRTLGVNLLLTAQNPSGVITSQIESNMGLRMCLRVAQEGESVAVVGIPDAGRLPTRKLGRTYVKKGGDPARLVQVAFIGQPTGEIGRRPLRVIPVRWYDAEAPDDAAAPEQTGPTVLTDVVGAVVAAAKDDGLTASRQLLLPPVPSLVTLDQVGTAKHHLSLGMQDLPEVPAHRPLLLPLGSGHLAIVGSARSGRTTALRALATGLALHGDVHLHIIDPNQKLLALQALPACGVVSRPDEERTDRLLDRLNETVTRRQAALAGRQMGDVGEWWATDPATAPPHIVLFIDGVSGLGIGANATGGDQRRERIARLLRTGLSAGITLVLATDEAGMRGIADHFSHLAVLRLNRPDMALTSAAAKRVSQLPDGRLLWKADDTEVQVPLIVDDPSAAAQNAAIAQHGRRLSEEQPEDERLLRLDILPEQEPFAKSLMRGFPLRGKGPLALLGVGGDRLRAVFTPLRPGESIVVLGPRRSGRTTALAAIAASLHMTGAQTLLVADTNHAACHGAQETGVTVVSRGELAARLSAQAWDAVVVDDARMEPAFDTLLAEAMGHSANRPLSLVTSALGEDYDGHMEKLLKQATRAAVAKLVLCPPTHTYANSVSLRLEREQTFGSPAGRGLAEAGGELLLVQVPDPAVSQIS